MKRSAWLTLLIYEDINCKLPFAVIAKVMWACWRWSNLYGCPHVKHVSGSGQETLSILGPSYVSVTSLPARLKVRVPLGWPYYHSRRQEGPLRPFTPHIRTQDGCHKLLEITFPPHTATLLAAAQATNGFEYKMR